MNLPGETANDRRAVPRHIRDGEHDMLEESMSRAPPPGRAAGRWMWLWICVVVLLAGGFGLWIALRSIG
jgi:hypothetical protein